MADPFRSEYRHLSVVETKAIAALKAQASKLYQELQMPGFDQTHPPANREMAIARTKLEECVMWATKAITG